MIKISQVQLQEMLKEASSTITELINDNEAKDAELAQFRRAAHAEKIAHQMTERGINPHLSHQEKVAGVLMGDKDLDVLEEAVGLSEGQKLASVVDPNHSVGGAPTGTATDNFYRSLAE